VVPREGEFEAHSRQEGAQRWAVAPLMEELEDRARAQGLWNLWLRYARV